MVAMRVWIAKEEANHEEKDISNQVNSDFGLTHLRRSAGSLLLYYAATSHLNIIQKISTNNSNQPSNVVSATTFRANKTDPHVHIAAIAAVRIS